MYTSPFPTVEIPTEPVTPFVFRHLEALADHPAMIDGPTGRTYTYAQLADATRRVAGWLTKRGFGKADVLGILLPNLPEYFPLFHGAATTGGTVTTINPTYGAEEVGFQLRDSGASLLVTIPMFVETAEQAVVGTDVTEIIVVGETDSHTPFSELLSAEPYEGHAAVDPAEDVVVLPYSSGTTGLPKGVMLTHRNLTANMAQIQHIMEVTPGEDRVIAVLPFFHIYGMQVLMNNVIHRGGTVVTMPRFDLPEFLRLLQDHTITIAYLVPPIVLALAKHPLVAEYDLSSLRLIFSGAAPLSGELADEARNRLGVSVVQGYGMTELSPVTHSTPEGSYNPASVGFTISNTETRIVDPATGEDAAHGDDGEVWIRGPQVMKGYLNNPAATAATIDDEGWLHTGDIGHFDDEGFLYVVDRLKELIKYKGFQVPPAELEGVLLTHPAIADAAVIGVPDEEAGEIPKAFVVVAPGATLTEDEVMDHVGSHVASYKRVRVVEFLDAIPKSASGKILRRELRSL
ncbi:MAG TPA: 4-coumarate--CoA ligase family protein [Acidimicrobiia bacterium]|nr:4-coumarate--CoA ligase family protein [Acidimicrobiia bacterium]